MNRLQLTIGIAISAIALAGPVAAQSPAFDAHTSMMIVDDPQEVVNIIALPPKSELIELRKEQKGQKGQKGGHSAEAADEARNETANEARRESDDAREMQGENPPQPEGNANLLELLLEQVGTVLE